MQRKSRKRGAIQLGLEQVTGQFVVIQDADLELRPRDLIPILETLKKGIAKVVYGSRFLNGKKRASLKTYIGNRMLASFTNLLYHVRITDEATCYKAFDTSLVTSLNLAAQGFEFCPEVTAKVLRAGYHIHEVPISYFPRTKEGGKKLRFWREGIRAGWTLFKYRFAPMSKILKKTNFVQ